MLLGTDLDVLRRMLARHHAQERLHHQVRERVGLGIAQLGQFQRQMDEALQQPASS